MVLSIRKLVSHVREASVGMGFLMLVDPRRSSVSLPDVGTWRIGPATADRRVTVGPSLRRNYLSVTKKCLRSLRSPLTWL